MRSGSRLTSGFLWILVACICAGSFAFMLYGALHDSAIVDEGAHIPAGYGYVHELSYDLNPEHPPLVKALAELPVLLLQPQFPAGDASWTTNVNDEWTVGRQFLYELGNDANAIIRVSRLAPILLTILLIVFIYFWSKKLMGGAWALLPTFLFAFDPTVLAHGHYVTTDIGAALGILLATYFFLKALREPSWKNIIIAGLALGVADLLKFSTALLIPYFIIIALVRFFMDVHGLHGKYRWQMAWRKLWQLALIFLIAYLIIVYPVYALLVHNYPQAKQVSDSQNILSSFAGGANGGAHCSIMRCIANVDMWMAGHSVTRPLGEYFLGMLMTLQRSVGDNTTYFLGTVSAAGSPWYFPVLYLLKESLPALLIVLTGLVLGLWAMARAIARRRIWPAFVRYLHEHFTEFSIIVFLVIYWAYSIHSPLNIGIRHLMPTLPLMYMLAALAWRKWVVQLPAATGGITLANVLTSMFSAARSVFTSWLKLSVLFLLLIWALFETFSAAPYFLSYFNEIGGGVWGGYHYVTDSNYDWGQDMLRLQTFVNAHPEIDKIAVDYFGTAGAPAYYLGGKEVDWWSARGNPTDQNIHWLAVSINTLELAIQPTSDGFYRKPEDSYSWLTALRPAAPGMGNVPTPDYRVGTTIFVYHLQ